jgi:hypothetical protein
MFDLKKIENGRMNVPEPEYYDAKASTEIQIGQALSLQSGVLAPVGGTTKPEFISLGKLAASAAKREIPVARVNDEQVYEVSVTAAPTSLKVGNKVTLSSDGMEVTATTSDGVATIVNLCGAVAAGDKILVKFV